ncbi:MAG: MFS transporter [Armatimonadetes bacterium]|nr:MFS transporter [Armatimonadota bacterium]
MLFEDRLPPNVRDVYKRDATTGMLGAVMFGMAIPFFANIARHTLRASEVEVGIIMMAPVAGNLLSFVWANMMEGKRKMPFAVISWIAARALLCTAFFITSAHWFVALVAMFWVITSIAGPAYSALMKEMYPDSDRGRIMGYVRVLSFFIIAISTLAAGPLLQTFGYRYVFPFVGLFGVAAALAFHTIPTKETTGDPNVPIGEFILNSIRILLEDGGYRWFCGGIFISGFANFFASAIFVIYQVDELGVGQSWTALYSFVTLVVSMMAYYYWGHHVDRKSPTHLLLVCNLIFAGIPLIYCVATQAWMLLPAMALMGFVFAGYDLAYFNGVLHYAPKDRITQYQAVFAFLMGLRGITAPFMGALFVKWHWLSMAQVFIIAAALTLLSCPVLIIGERKYRTLNDALPAPVFVSKDCK